MALSFLRNKSSWIIGLLALALLFPVIRGMLPDPGSSTQPTTQPVARPRPAIQVPPPDFNADSAFAGVKKQVGFGPRVPGTPAHKKCAAWLVTELKRRGLNVIEQPFKAPKYTGDGAWSGVNIIAQYRPENPRRVLLAAHWDSRFIADKDTRDTLKPIDGADDGGSGVAVLLEIARHLQQTPVDIGVDLILFDVEDQGDDDDNAKPDTWCLGSQHWAKNMHAPGYSPYYAILLDMVGAKNAQFKKEGISRQVAPRLVNQIWDLAASMGYGQYFIQQEVPGITDDHAYVIKLARIPMIDVISMPNDTPKIFGDYHHRHADNLSIIDPQVLKAVGQVMTTVIYQTYNNGGEL